ncbi:MAG: hypothetical protein V3V41_00220 [Candidatus Heimdallarchaeota archaeon]
MKILEIDPNTMDYKNRFVKFYADFWAPIAGGLLITSMLLVVMY